MLTKDTLENDFDSLISRQIGALVIANTRMACEIAERNKRIDELNEIVAKYEISKHSDAGKTSGKMYPDVKHDSR